MTAILPSTTITAAGTFTGTPQQLRVPAVGLGSWFVSAQANFTWGSGGTTVNAYLQTSFDSGTTWCDAISFTQFALASARMAASLVLVSSVSAAATDGTLVAATNANVFGPWWRVKYVVVGTYAGGTTLRVDMFSNSNFNAAGPGSFN